mgnify:CR=1 FL=1
MATNTTATTQNHNGTGSQNNFAISFAFLANTEVDVTVGGVLKTLGTHYNIVGSQVQFTSGNTPPSGTANVVFTRDTNISAKKVDFADGSVLTETDLDNNSDQILFGLQEIAGDYVKRDGSQTITGDLVFEGATDDDNETTLAITNPTDDRTITIPDITGTVVTTGDTGTVSNQMIAGDAVTNAKIADDSIDSEHYVDLSIDTQHIANENVTTAKLENNAVSNSKLGDNAVDSRNYVDGSIDHEHLANDIIDGDNIQDDVINSEHYVAGSIDHEHLANDIIDGDNIQDDVINSEHYVAGSIDHEHLANDIIDGDNVQDNAINNEHIADDAVTNAKIADGTLDGRYYTETELDAGQLDNRYFTETELTNGALDGRYFTETEADARYFNISTGDTIKDGDTFPDNDTTIATTAAINDRIIDLVDDVGGFVPIASETSFPTANPDVNNGSGTLVSIKAIGSTRTPSSGTVTISNGAGTGNTVTITGCGSTVLTAGFGVIVETTSTLHTYAFHRLVPKATEVSTVAANATNIAAAGANTTNINTVAGINSNVTTVAGISSNVTTVAGIQANVTTVAGISSDITAVAADATDIGAVAAKATEIGRLGTADAVADMNTLGTTAIVSDMDTLADISSNITTVAGISSNVTTVAGISSNVTTVAGISSNVTSVANDATDIGTVAGSISNVNTVASNISSVNSFANTYRIGANNPTDSLDVGDLFFNTTSDSLKVYTGSAWVDGVTQTGNFALKTGNTFTGSNIHNDNVKSIYGTSSDGLEIFHSGNHSFITDSGTGDLFIRGDNNFFVQSGTGENKITAATNGAVGLYHNDNLKIETASTGVSVTGNIVVSGNVDGRDVAADGTKLDGIESGATADQTANEILTLLSDQHIATTGQFRATGSGQTSGLKVVNAHESVLQYFETNNDNSDFFINYSGSGGAEIKLGYDGKITLSQGSSKKIETTTAGATITGNLAVTGTVDGRDVAADGTKLDGIESNATADQTKSDIDALNIKAGTIDIQSTSSNFNYDVVFANGSGDKQVAIDGGSQVKYNPSSNTLTAGVFEGSGQSLTNLPAANITGTLPAIDGSNLTGINTDLVSDTSPQLGGTLDTNGQDVDFKGSDGNTKILFDNSQDQLELADGAALTFGDHTGTGDYSISYVNGADFTILGMNGGSGDLVLGTYALGTTTKTLVSKRSNNALELYFADSKKAETVTGGFTVTGTCTATAFAGDGSGLTGISAGATGGGSDEIFYENGQNVTTSYTITNGKNAMAAGPITIDSNVTVTVGAGETLTIV